MRPLRAQKRGDAAHSKRFAQLARAILDFQKFELYSAGVTTATIEPASHARSQGEAQGSATVTQSSEPADKIALFRSLFRGRDDVYPRRFESRTTGRSGYQPACANEWVRGICEKPRIRCAECPNRAFLPVTHEVIRWHLSGKDNHERDFVMGVYPMLLDETCHFLAADFDRDSWQEDARAFLATCQRLGLPAALERSRSGRGGHVWLFFAEAIPARLARNLGAHVLTETMEGRPDIGLRSYDRFFPNQDTLPKGGFGNLLALPLQKRARLAGNTVFLDEHFIPYLDQWAFLASLRRIERAQVQTIVSEADRRGTILAVRSPQEEDGQTPWLMPPSRRRQDPIAGPLPDSLELVLADQIYISKQDLPAPLRNRLVRLAAFQNPEFYQAQAMRLPTYRLPRIIDCAEDHPNHIGLPRGCLDEALALLRTHRVEPVLLDERFGGKPLPLAFRGELRPEQHAAVQALLAHDFGVLSAGTAFGKTVVAACLIARRGVNTLVLVHRRQLLEQWVERLAVFLGLDPKEIGRIGGGRNHPTGALDVALIQSMVRKSEVNDLVGTYGHLVVDECHHLSAHSFELVARRAKAKFVIGLSATITRPDGRHPIIFQQCGPVRYRIDPRRQAAARPFAHQVLVRPTGFRAQPGSNEDPRSEFRELYKTLETDTARNRLICDDILQVVREGRSPLVLTERIQHVQALAALLSPAVKHLIVLRGGMSRKELQQSLNRLSATPQDEARVVLATGRFIGEGFDDARLDTLFLGLPISWRGTIAQYAGRLHRLCAGKSDVRIYDYADLDVPMLARMFDRRCRGYEAQGYSVLLPASALPGWPADVPLPVDPVWKRDYAASVRRLLRDGVDSPLANLFVQAAPLELRDAEGAARARSASEAFLYRRLETLAETAGCFRLNVELPIAFDQRGLMEVDLLCANARLVIELDGSQHLADAEAYRRDRRKDALLQQHGYFVLRFLSEDVAKQLDQILDTILRTISRQSRPTAEAKPQTL